MEFSGHRFFCRGFDSSQFVKFVSTNLLPALSLWVHPWFLSCAARFLSGWAAAERRYEGRSGRGYLRRTVSRWAQSGLGSR